MMDASVWNGASPPPPPTVRPRFVGTVGAMTPVVIKGLLLTLVTLGIYRFWYTTNIRRFLWGATEVDGDAIEYTGRGVELFIGFLIALAVLVPLYGGVGLLSVLFGPVVQAVVQPILSIGIVILAQYALFRARRYRLTRTIWRGIRFQQSGSGMAYAGLSIGWSMVAMMTFGLGYPFMRASLENYKMTNTWYGDQQGGFTATGWGLFKRGWLLWLLFIVLAVGPFVAFGVTATGGKEALANSAPTLAAAFGLAFIGVIMLVPIYQAIEFRWWADGCSIGPATARAELGIFGYLSAYLAFLGAALVVVLIFGAAGFGVFSALGEDAFKGEHPEIMIAGAASYFAFGVVIAALWQLFGARLIWKRSLEGVSIVNLAVLTAAQSSAPPANAFGEGIADAIDFSGF